MQHSNRDDFILTAADGQRLSATWLTASASGNGVVCIIGPAMGVPRRFYDDFAHFLAGGGFDVLSFDFRGFGGSAEEELHFADGFACFGLDLSAAIERAGESGKKIVYVGHSLGVQALGLSPENGRIARAVSVASGTGYYGWSPFPENALRYVFWTIFFPAATRVAGYYTNGPKS